MLTEPTNLKFHDDPYARTATAWLDGCDLDENGQPFVVLSATVAYPQGGGQKGDRGTISIGDEAGPRRMTLTVLDTRKRDQIVRHYIDADRDIIEAIKEKAGNEEAEVSIDWSFRYRQMRLHSIAHLIHCFIEREMGAPLPPPSYSELSEDGGTNRYDGLDVVSPELLEKALISMTAFLAENHEIKTYPDEAKGAHYRLWECGAWRIPCGGTHPRSTAEIGPFTATVSSRKKKTNITFSLSE